MTIMAANGLAASALLLTLLTTVAASGVLKTPVCMELDEPLTMTIHGPQRITLHGTIFRDSWLGIQLVDGEDDICSKDVYKSCNILLHFVTRYNANQIVRNSYVLNDTSVCNGSAACGKGWGPEELSAGLPLRQGVPFEIVILCETNYFQVYIDNKHFASYAYRIPLEKATHVILSGRVSFRKVDISGSHNLEGDCQLAERCPTVNHININ